MYVRPFLRIDRDLHIADATPSPFAWYFPLPSPWNKKYYCYLLSVVNNNFLPFPAFQSLLE